jgi:hypothetical protein
VKRHFRGAVPQKQTITRVTLSTRPTIKTPRERTHPFRVEEKPQGIEEEWEEKKVCQEKEK